MTSSCTRRAEIEHWARQGFAAGGAERYAQHVAECPSCASFIEQIQSLRTEFASLPEQALEDVRLARVRQELVAAATAPDAKFRRLPEHGPRLFGPRWAIAAGFALIVAASAFAGFKRSGTPTLAKAPISVAEVTLVDSAIGHTLQPGPNEVYELVQGLAEFSVRHLDVGQRYRVLIGDDQVEVRGTSFQVVAQQRHLQSVKVIEGRVQVSRSGQNLTLDAGQRWVATLPADAPEPDSSGQRDAQREVTADGGAPTSLVTAAPRGSSMASKAPPSDPELFDVAFNAALSRLRAGDASGAVADFDTLLKTQSIDSGRKSDALYWSAVACHRSGNDTIAEQRLRQLLASSTSGWHAPEASLMLGEILVARGAPQLAKPWLERAAQSNRPNTSKKASQLLDRISAK